MMFEKYDVLWILLTGQRLLTYTMFTVPAPAHEIHDSNVFMKELTRSTYTHGPMKRKKKPQSPSSRQKNASATPEPATGSAQSPLATDPAVMSSAETVAIQLSSVPTVSFS